MKWKSLQIPTVTKEINSLKAGDRVLLNGILYSARDKAHQRLCNLIKAGEPLPFDLKGQFIYYVGPSPSPPGKIIGSAGPTTSNRMDPFTEVMLKAGVKGMIGKGKRDASIRQLFPYYEAIYMSSFGGAGAYLSKKITNSTVIAFDDLGPEAIYLFEVKDFPVIVINDVYGSDLYEDIIQKK